MAVIKTSLWKQETLIERTGKYECSEADAHKALTNYLSRGYHHNYKPTAKSVILHKHRKDGTHNQIYIEF